MPAAATEDTAVTVSWRATAHFTQLWVDGAQVFTTVPPATANGSFRLPGLKADTTVTLIAHDYLGLKVSQTRTIKVVRAPKASTFTLPATPVQ